MALVVIIAVPHCIVRFGASKHSAESIIGEEGSDKTVKTRHSSNKLLKSSAVYSNSAAQDCSHTGNY